MLHGIGLSNFRSFGEEMQRIGPLKKINLIIGQNNSGKSNILLFLNRYLNKAMRIDQNRQIDIGRLDKHYRDDSREVGFEIAFQPDDRLIQSLVEKADPHRQDSLRSLLNTLFTSDALCHGTAIPWLRFDSSRSDRQFHLSSYTDPATVLNCLNPEQWNDLRGALAGSSDGKEKKHWIRLIMEAIQQSLTTIPPVRFVSAIRRIGDPKSTTSDWSGDGINRRLAELQNPKDNDPRRKELFAAINRFLKLVTDTPSAQLHIPYDYSILVEMDSHTFPLENLGTGIHEVVMLGAAATISQNSILCIEEPELHLHPLLQKKLIRHFATETSNQYLLTTHSAHLLDTEDAAIFHVRHANGCSQVRSISADFEKCMICADLGYRASDILQANCVIWVEGPSDRVYLNHWIKAKDESLREGLHYSIMFYGGRLLSHLSATDKEVDDFIALRKLNQYLTIVIDSDRTKADKDLNATKSRICTEFDQGPGFSWVTAGREVENYIPATRIIEAVSSIKPKVVSKLKTGQYDNCLKYPVGTKHRSVDKMKVATFVASLPADFSFLDLNERIQVLVEFIKKANLST